MEFDADGNFIQGWGHPQTTPWVANEHGIHVDKAGFVWIAGNSANDSAIFKYTKDGKPVLTIGKLGPTGGSNEGGYQTIIAPGINQGIDPMNPSGATGIDWSVNSLMDHHPSVSTIVSTSERSSIRKSG